MSFLNRKEREAVEEVFVRIEHVHGIDRDMLVGTSLNRKIVQARQFGYYVLRKRFNLTLPAIGAVFNRDHTTIMHGVDAVRARDQEAEALGMMTV